jgi:glutamate synthase domain-containing protein 2
MLDTFKLKNNYPDFITIDGGEGGTGAAPIEFTNSVGMPLYDALPLVKKGLIDRNLNQIKIITSAKVMTAFDIIKMLSLGADVVNSARAFLLSLGCIQARLCDKNTCPTGITTQNKHLIKGLDPKLKSVRVFNYHNETIKSVKELMSALGVVKTCDISASKIYRRLDSNNIKSLEDIYLNR